MSITLPTTSRRRLAPLLTVVGICFGTMASSYAVNYIWLNTGTDWNTSSSWNPSSGIPNAGGDVAIFNTAAVTSPNISSSVLISRLTANSASSTGYTLSSSGGAALTLGTLGTGTASAINYSATSGSFQISAPIILGAAADSTQTFHVVSSGGTVSITGAISSTNSVQLEKSGAGTLVLSSSLNSYSGGTRISAGSVQINGNGSLGTGTITLNTGTLSIADISGSTFTHGSTLNGNGTVNGGGKTLATTGINPDGIISASAITLSLTGTSVFDFTNSTFAPGSFDLFTGTAGGGTESVIFGGTLTLNFSGGTYANGSSVQIFDVDDYSGNFSALNFTGLDGSQSAVFDAATGSVTVVPEPASWVLLGLGAVLIACFRIRRTRRNSNPA